MFSCPTGTSHKPCQPAHNTDDQENDSAGTMDHAPPTCPVCQDESEAREKAQTTHLDKDLPSLMHGWHFSPHTLVKHVAQHHLPTNLRQNLFQVGSSSSDTPTSDLPSLAWMGVWVHQSPWLLSGNQPVAIQAFISWRAHASSPT